MEQQNSFHLPRKNSRLSSSPQRREIRARAVLPHARAFGMGLLGAQRLSLPAQHPPIGANDDALPLQVLLFHQRMPRVSFHTATLESALPGAIY